MTRLKTPKAAKDPAYLAAIHELPCCVCQSFGMTQESPTQAHHTICGRYSGAKTPDREAIPLCADHHQGLWFIRDKSKIAIHKDKAEWVRRYGEDTVYISQTLDTISGTR